MVLKQTIHRSQKSACGIIGNTRKKKFVAILELIYHEMLAISNIFREISGINISLTEENVISKADIATGEQKVQAIITPGLSSQYREMKIHFSLSLTVLNTTQSPTRSYV
jgi:hypothetical protein